MYTQLWILWDWSSFVKHCIECHRAAGKFPPKGSFFSRDPVLCVRWDNSLSCLWECPHGKQFSSVGL